MKTIILGLFLFSQISFAASPFIYSGGGIKTLIPLNGVLKSSSNQVVGNATTDDLTEGSSNFFFTSGRTDARITLQKAQPNGLATLDSNGMVPSAQLPALAISNTYVVGSQAAMLALSANVGDVAIRTDTNETFILQTAGPSVLSHWVMVLTPAAPVQSVNGQVGIVSLNSDQISEGGSNLYFLSSRARGSVSASSPLSYNSSSGLFSISQSTSLQDGYLSSSDWVIFNTKQAAGSYLTALTSDVSASGPGSAAATVNSVGGSSAANLHSAELAANAATSSNTASTLVKRDISGNFSAGAITASLTGTASGNTTITPNNHGVVLSGSGNALNVLAPDASTTKVLVSGGTSADPSYQTLSTTNITEGSNLYYTDTRVQTAAKNNTSAQLLYVSKDVGSDSTGDGSLLKPYRTIQTAINTANGIASYYKQVVINIEPSNASSGYSENLTLSQQGVTLQCSQPIQNARACLVSGTLTVNLTGTSGGANFIAASNEVYANGMVFASGSSNTISFSGSTYQRLILSNCYIQASGAMAVNETNTGSSSGTPSELRSYDTTFENNSASIPTVTLTAGRFWLYGTIPTVQNDNTSGISVTQNGPSSMTANLTQFVGEYNLTDNTATATFNLSTIASGTNPCIVTPSSPSTGYALMAYFGCNSTNTNSVTGSGVVAPFPGNARISTSGDIISTVTQSVLPGLPQGEVMIGAGATTGTNVLLSIKGGHTKITQATAPTALVSSNAGTGATCTLSNASDAAGKVNLTTTAVSPASGAQCTVTFNKAYGVAPICTFSPANNNSVLFAVANGVFFTTTTTTLVVNYANADSIGHANNWTYHCMETQ